MKELIVNPMSDERIIETLKELKKMWLGKSPLKYQFALGYAIRKFEEPPNYVNTIDTKSCGFCSGFLAETTMFKYCPECGRALNE